MTRRRAGLAVVLLALFGLAAPAARASEEGGGGNDGPRYVRFEPLIVSVLSDDSIRGVLEVTLQLRVANEHARELIEAKRPRLIDAFNRFLIMFGQYYANVYKPLDVKGVAAQLQQAADAELGKSVCRVLVTQAAIRSV